MTLDPSVFRSLLGRFASGVTIVTALGSDGNPQGMTVSAFCSLSLQPPLVLMCIDKTAAIHEMLISAKVFTVNVLAAHQEELARRFATTDPDKYAGVGYTAGREGVPILDEVLAVAECVRTQSYFGGDHTIVIGEVCSAHVSEGKPLLYYRGGYAQLDR
jgi:flavin reductase (DIM6/NTAB) family NADH-FMN oxidoreductase RutF